MCVNVAEGRCGRGSWLPPDLGMAGGGKLSVSRGLFLNWSNASSIPSHDVKRMLLFLKDIE
ncbi:hypothetical protein HMPREF3039_03204 [Akkermansia sp. KLE1798]|nr:hypothetical protein HMPREF3039_03204 [Akkermansia sp. KLE1798]KZA04107.1 hypothetical protein HMPREF1326_02305 [Akkermansia sp. KLE1605]